ncbi:hypothetical protein OG875_27520 [Streptomyces sp. NBC_01498]|uniref:hypothetical protein n=1 Tax=Streptomyces sp. NBC_01498 TaxID=2975870 RepID=UPI002E7BB27A|nr:hypothetical protein [Streptomyces sp. NBC_01498]WTL27991.1 hypothetical protein OG875_27520 [Streptomyces sp. NBC_01498]
MISLERRFDEDFHVAADGPTLAIDFWSYLNALQARLGWTPADDRTWDYLEELGRDIEPLIETLPDADAAPYLRRLVDRWAARGPGERDDLRQSVAAMLLAALRRGPVPGAAAVTAAAPAPGPAESRGARP